MIEIEQDPVLIHPIVDSLPASGRELYRSLSTEQLDVDQRFKNPDLALEIDGHYSRARQAYLLDPNEHRLDELRRAIGTLGGFNFIDSMYPIRWDGTADVDYNQMRLGPSASTQVIQIADVKKNDRVLELFSGAGYFTFFLAISNPEALTSVDLFTPQIYDLRSGLQNTYSSIFSKLPEEVRPRFKSPEMVQEDCTALPTFETDFNKVFLHPPYGRESRLIVDISETQAFLLWLNSLASARAVISGEFQTFSPVPTQWAEVVESIKSGVSPEEIIAELERKIKDNGYFRTDSDVDTAGMNWEEIRKIFADSKTYPLISKKGRVSVVSTSHSPLEI